MTAGRTRRRIGEGVKLSLALASAIALLFAGLVMSVYNDHLYKVQKARDIGVEAQILAATVTAALTFDDRASAQEYTNALRRNPEIEAVGVYDEAGEAVAGFTRGGDLPAHSRTFEPSFTDGRLTLGAPVVQGGSALGSVYLRVVTDPLWRRMIRYGGIMLLVGMAALVVTVLGIAQAALQRRAADLAEANRLLQEQIEERERAEEALRQSQKMEAIGRITGGVAHDFNNLLMVASSGLDLMDRTKDAERRQVLKDGIRQALDRGAGLTRQLLAFSRRTPLKTEVVDLRRHIEGLRVLLDRSLREDISVERKVAEDLWPVEIDPSQFELALLNVAVNARDAMPGGGVITIEAENLPGMDDGALAGDFVRLSVSDRGEGIPPEVLAHVFEPFFTTKEVGTGTGLGLSQVYGFAKSSGGEVRIDSTLGEGATISLYMPRSTRPPDEPEAVAAGPRRATAKGQRVLLVEDDDGVAAMVLQMLDALGYEAERASTAAIALVTLQRAADFDVVFSDLVMPGGMDGIDLAREIMRQRPSLPILLTTGYSEAAAAAASEGLQLLAKPYTIDALAVSLQATISERRTRRG